ncbi:hypothetical protein H8Z72_22685 (plasmid) [Xanthomonas citri pv. citri]|uniref:hypothetical protein n=1 Tax=Xanthomonas citri TaxID=346 RepID=UPI0019342DBA|nr:hypothetical protein [Xanthomonas citri]QRD62663.1 hypothetical protein H8Z74_23500 [Xanthomonas citri pv. citri]QRD67198.1 hypothetical protein H8Z73_22480 [Xanthomonas citri pv. citri]QRD71757.1 hypothetical protein H8Z72_22685 [Xanthomonas citri pv. citri]
MDKLAIAELAETTRVCLSLSKILDALHVVRERTEPADFVTRRWHKLAMDELFNVDLDRMRISDLHCAFAEASNVDSDGESPDQHTCRYMARVLSIARHRSASNPRRGAGESIRPTEIMHPR